MVLRFLIGSDTVGTAKNPPTCVDTHRTTIARYFGAAAAISSPRPGQKYHTEDAIPERPFTTDPTRKDVSVQSKDALRLFSDRAGPIIRYTPVLDR